MLRIALPLALALLCCAAPGFAAAPAAEPVFPRFDVRDTGAPPAGVPEVAPWRIVALDPDYAGQWAVAGDVDGDGAVEVVAAENVNVEDTHYTSAVAAHRLDGSVLWRWGNPDAGRKNWHHDVACQIHDWDGDGKDTIAIRRGNAFHVRNTLTTGNATQVFWYGRPGETVLVGDWDGNGTDTIAIRRGDQVHVNNALTSGNATRVTVFATDADHVLVGDIDGDGTDTLGVYLGISSR